MTKSIFRRVIVPVANQHDAAATTNALFPYVAGTDCTVTAVHVIEKAGGALDKASVEQRERDAREMFAVVKDGLDDSDVSLDTEIRYGTDVARTLIDAAHDVNATTILFTPRGGSRWKKLLAGNVTHKLVENSDIPVLVLPDTDEGTTTDESLEQPPNG